MIMNTEKVIDVRVDEVRSCPLPFFVDMVLQGADGKVSCKNLSSHEHRYQADKAASHARMGFIVCKAPPAQHEN